jgi:hypothetical protein
MTRRTGAGRIVGEAGPNLLEPGEALLVPNGREMPPTKTLSTSCGESWSQGPVSTRRCRPIGGSGGSRQRQPPSDARVSHPLPPPRRAGARSVTSCLSHRKGGRSGLENRMIWGPPFPAQRERHEGDQLDGRRVAAHRRIPTFALYVWVRRDEGGRSACRALLACRDPTVSHRGLRLTVSLPPIPATAVQARRIQEPNGATSLWPPGRRRQQSSPIPRRAAPRCTQTGPAGSWWRRGRPRSDRGRRG